MTVDLDELERLRQIAMALWQPDTMHEWAPAQDAWSAALRNAFPALAKELRELREQASLDLEAMKSAYSAPDELAAKFDLHPRLLARKSNSPS